jgi:hypothetical protein
MNEATIIGIKPWLPWPLSKWSWWCEPVHAERLAALRIGLAAVLLVDVLGTYWPRAPEFFGRDSLGSSEVFCRSELVSFLGWLDHPSLLQAAMAAWALAALLLLVGWYSRHSAAAAWLLSQAFLHLDPYIHNAGDTVRTIILFYLMLSPCGAVWSLDSLRHRRRWARSGAGTVFIYPWALRLLFLQMATIYFYNGIHKLVGPQWRAGSSMYYVLSDLTLSRLSLTQLPAPYVLTQLLTWTVLLWEVGFPFLALLPAIRTAALVMGVVFHLGIGLSLELGMFAPYMLCLYLPLVPWVRPVERNPREFGEPRDAGEARSLATSATLRGSPGAPFVDASATGSLSLPSHFTAYQKNTRDS